MFVDVLYILAGFALLTFAADRLVVAASRISSVFGLSPVLIGAVVVGLGTSLPEMLVSGLAAAEPGGLDFALGNIVGSNVANLSLVLGTSALISPIIRQPRVIAREGSVMLIGSALFAYLVFDDQLTQSEGLILAIGLLVAMGLIIGWSTRDRSAMDAALSDLEDMVSSEVRPLREAAFAVVSLGLTLLGAELLVRGARSVAETLGVSDAIISLTLVAIGTSLPELATAIAAARREPERSRPRQRPWIKPVQRTRGGCGGGDNRSRCGRRILPRASDGDDGSHPPHRGHGVWHSTTRADPRLDTAGELPGPAGNPLSDTSLAGPSPADRSPMNGINSVATERQPDAGARRLFERQLGSLDLDRMFPRDPISEIALQATGIRDTVEDLLVSSRAQLVDPSVAKVPVDLTVQIAQVIEAGGRSMQRVITPDHPVEERIALGDPARVRQVIRNLLSNALTHGGREVLVKTRRRVGTLYVSVQDDGQGLSHADEARISHRVPHQSQTDVPSPSIGMGLAVSHELAHMMDGELTYRRENGRSVFEFALPSYSD